MGVNPATSFDVFFSYHWRDHDPVEAVARTLTERGLRVFLDRWYLTPGQPWPQALEHTLACCNSVAVFLGVDGLGPWQQRERDLALDRQGREPGFPVIPVLLTRNDPALGFLKLNTWVDLSSNVADQAALDILCAAIWREPPGPPGRQQITAVRAEICPYRGLRPFREEDATFFCGREAFTEKLVEAVERTALVAVVGASGIGKSSVVRAGLIPRLRRTKAGRVWEIATLVPTDRPLHSLAAALVAILEPEITRVDRLAEINELAGHLAVGTVALRDVAADVLRTQPGTDRLLLFVNQWEELYTLVTDEGARRRFLAEILDASAKGPVTVVLTLRGDFFGQALSDQSFADRLQGAQVNLGPMTEEELERSITAPAEKAGLQFEPGLVERILEDIGQEPGHLPLLEFMLAALWEQRQGITLHHDAYERMGGVEGAIAARADAEFERLDAAQKDAARRMLIQMVRPGEETEDTRQRAVLPAGNETALTVIRRLADARLVVTARDAASGLETVEVTHEALIRHWTLLRTWVDLDREFLRRKVRIEMAAALWEQDSRPPDRLLPPGRALDEGEEILARRRADLSARIVTFIEASAAAAARIRRRTLITRSAALAALLLAVAGGGLYWDFYLREHEEYYNSFAKRWGVLEGIGRISADDAEHRSRTLRFVRKGRLGPVTRVDAIDGGGICARGGMPEATCGGGCGGPDPAADKPTRMCSVAWERDSKGRVSRQTMLDATGRVIASLVYTGGDGRTAEFRGEGGYLLPIGVATTITYERIEDGPNRGQDRLERYTDASGQPKPFIGEVFASQAEYNPQGLLVRAVSLGSDGARMWNISGFAEVRVRYDKAGSPLEVSLLDESGDPVRAKNGVARWTMTYDARGNKVKEDYFDEKGSPTRNKDGYATLIFAYGAGGKETERKYFDEAGKPTPNKEGYAKIAREFDPQGRPVKEAYFDEAGKPTLSKDGHAKVIKQYDGSGNPVGEAYFDQAGKPTRNKEGYAKIARTYDARGQLLEEAYFDQEGKPTRNKEGYTEIARTYDARGQLLEETYFDEAGKPTLSKEAYAKLVKTYDDHGNEAKHAYFDEAGKPTLSKDGYATITKEYDAAGHLISEAYSDELGKPTPSKEGYAKVTKQYNGTGHHVAEAYFDEAGKSTVTKAGYASVQFDHDARGNMVRRNYYDENGKPTRSKDHYAVTTRTYDVRGNIVSEAFFDEEGKPCLDENGVARTGLWYDEQGNKVKQAHFDETGKPTLSKEGVAQMVSTYDTRGNRIEEAYLDEAEKPTRAIHGYAKVTRAYDARGNVIEEAYFDGVGKPTAFSGYTKITLVYDARGSSIENRYFDEESKPTLHKDGFSVQRVKYDERGNATEYAYFGLDGEPTLHKDGFSVQRVKYDERGNATEYAYFGLDDEPTLHKDGFAVQRIKYDERGNQTEYAHFGLDGEPTLKDGFAVQRVKYDERGNATEYAYFGLDGEPTLHKDGFAVQRAKYDERGSATEYVLFGLDGSPTKDTDGVATSRSVYDQRGNLLERAYFDNKGRRTKSTDGFAIRRMKYDALAREVEQIFFDENEKPTLHKDGYAKIVNKYLDGGSNVETFFLNFAGKIVKKERPK